MELRYAHRILLRILLLFENSARYYNQNDRTKVTLLEIVFCFITETDAFVKVFAQIS